MARHDEQPRTWLEAMLDSHAESEYDLWADPAPRAQDAVTPTSAVRWTNSFISPDRITMIEPW